MQSGFKHRHHGQMSESILTVFFLSLSGGLQDAYTYLFRGGVYANAQTGNIVMLSASLFDGNFAKAPHYLVPLVFFALGVWVAERIRIRFKSMQQLHWRQLIVLDEIIMLFAVGFMPQQWNTFANALVSFACAMQVQAFRKVNGYGFASTMCIGNMRSGMEALCTWQVTHNAKALEKAMHYFGVIFVFALGAGIGSMSIELFGARTIWLSSAILLVSFVLMFIKEECE